LCQGIDVALAPTGKGEIIFRQALSLANKVSNSHQLYLQSPSIRVNVG
jgi:hypothetical protein